MLVASSLLRAEPYKEAAGPHKVETLNADWTDAARQRTLPVKIYYPTNLEAPASVILFSHGLGGSREVGAYLGRHWASHGYVCVFLQHPGSDTSAWQGKRNPMESLRQTLRDPSVHNRLLGHLPARKGRCPKMVGWERAERIGWQLGDDGEEVAGKKLPNFIPQALATAMRTSQR